MKKGRQKIAALLCTCMMVNLVFPASAGRLEAPVKRSSKTQLSSNSNLILENEKLENNLTKKPEKAATNSNIEESKETSTTKLPARMALNQSVNTTAKDLSTAKIDIIGAAALPYTGSAFTPEIKVTLDGTILTKDTDYSVNYSNNIDVGNITITVNGIGNYTGSVTNTKLFTISQGSIINLLKENPCYERNGEDFIWYIPFGTSLSEVENQLNEATQKNGIWKLKADAAFTQPGDHFDKSRNQCFATFTSSTPNYGDSNPKVYVTVREERNINAQSITPTFKDYPTATFPYTGNPIEPEIVITDELWGSTQTLPQNTTYDITYKNNTQPGTATATITGKGVYTGTREITFEIKEVPAIANAKITLPETAAYTGSPIVPEPTVELAGKTLTKGTDYTLFYDKNTDPGAAYVTVTGTAQGDLGYYGSKTASFFILPPANLTATYGTLLSQISSPLTWFNTNWQWKEANGFVGNVGTQTPLAKFNDGTTQRSDIPVTVTVSAKAISDSSVKLQLPGAPFVYHPDHPITPEPALVDEALKQTLVKDRDYMLSYTNNTNAGTGTVTITGKGNYTGTRTENFTINKADIELTITDKNGKKLEANETIKLMARDPASVFTVTRHGDGAITYSDAGEGIFTAADAATGTTAGVSLTPTAPGNARLTVQVAETTNYKGITSSFPVVVSRIPISRTQIQIAAPGSWTYHGNAFTPALTITDPKLSSGNPLTAGTEYSLAYTDNINAGEAKITVSGLGDYEGTVIVPFTIHKADYQAEPPARITAVYGQQLKELSLPKADPYELFWAWKQPENEVGNVGEHAVDVYLEESQNYNEKTASLTVSVEPKALEASMIHLEYEEHAYTGKALEPSVTVTYRNRTVSPDQYTVSYADNSERGTATVTLTGKNNFTGTVTKQFQIVKAKILSEHVTLTPEEWIYNGTQHTPTETVIVYGNTLKKDMDYTITYGENIHAGNDASVTITGQGNYTGSATVFFTIEKAVNPATPSNIRYQAVYGQKLGEIAVDGDWDWENPEDLVGNAGENQHPIFLAETRDYLKKMESAILSVARKPLEETMVTVDNKSLIYDGLEKRPTVQVKDDKARITAEDYEILYENNLHAGEALVIVRAKGNYSGEIKKNFTIEKAQPTLHIGAGLSIEKALREGSFSLDAVLSNGENLSYASSNPAVAAVDSQGMVTLLTAGNTNLTVSYSGSQDYTPVEAVAALTVTNRSAGSSNSSGGGRSGSRSITFIYNSIPAGYNGETKVIGNARVPVYVESGTWNQEPDGSWKLTDAQGQPVISRWIAAYNPYANLAHGQSAFDWFRFDADGKMLVGWYQDVDGELYYLNPDSDCTKGRMVTGWYMIDGVWYYFEPRPDGKRGRLLRNTVTPDGYPVDENGAWIQ